MCRIKLALIILTSILVCSLNLQSQDFGSNGAIWTYKAQFTFGGDFDPFIITINSLGKEEFENRECNVLQISAETCSGPMVLKNYVYQLEDKVYWYNALISDFTIIYDFSKEVGESWTTRITETCTIENVVDSISLTEIDDLSLKTIHYKSGAENVNTIAIEQIGTINRFILPPSYHYQCNAFCDGVYILEERCFQDNDIFFKISDDSLACDQLVSINKLPDENVFKLVSPNPVNDELEIKSTKDIEKLNILNSTGQIIYSVIKPDLNIRINTANWESGVYIINLISKGKKRIYTERIVKL